MDTVILEKFSTKVEYVQPTLWLSMLTPLCRLQRHETNNATEVSPALPGPPSEADLSEQVGLWAGLGSQTQERNKAGPSWGVVGSLPERNQPSERALVLGTLRIAVDGPDPSAEA